MAEDRHCLDDVLWTFVLSDVERTAPSAREFRHVKRALYEFTRVQRASLFKAMGDHTSAQQTHDMVPLNAV